MAWWSDVRHIDVVFPKRVAGAATDVDVVFPKRAAGAATDVDVVFPKRAAGAATDVDGCWLCGKKRQGASPV